MVANLLPFGVLQLLIIIISLTKYVLYKKIHKTIFPRDNKFTCQNFIMMTLDTFLIVQ